MKRTRVTLDLHPEVAKIVDRLQRSGIYGINRTKVVEGLFLAGLRAAISPAKSEATCKRRGWCYAHEGIHRP